MSAEQDESSYLSFARPSPDLPPPPAAKRRGRGRRLLVTAGVTAVVMAAGALLTAAFTGGGEPARRRAQPTVPPGPPAWTAAAGQWLESGSGIQYDGAMTVGGKPVRARLWLTPGGSATGALTAGPIRADVVTVDGTTYLRAGLTFWRDYAGEVVHPEYYAGRWSKAPAAMPGFDVPDVLGPKSIARALGTATGRPATESVGGRPAYKVRAPDAEYLVAAAAPYRLLAVRATGPNAPWFTAAPVTTPASMFARLRPRVAALGGAADPGMRFRPGALPFSNCDQNTSGCTVSVPATLASPAGAVPSAARAALRASITSRGAPLGSCARSEPVPADRALVLRCTVTSRQWRRWVKSALDNPGSYPYEATAHVVGEALDAGDVPKLLAIVDRERAALAKPAPATPRPPDSAEPSVNRTARPEVVTSATPQIP